MKPSVIIAIIVVVVIVLGGAWYVYSNQALAEQLGLRHAPVASTTATSTSGHQFGFRGGFATGTIEVLNDNGFTLTLQNGTTKNVNITATTTIENYANASSTPAMINVDQLSVGEQVFAIGTPNPDGSINATRVVTGSFPTGPARYHGQGTTGAGAPMPAPQPD